MFLHVEDICVEASRLMIVLNDCSDIIYDDVVLFGRDVKKCILKVRNAQVIVTGTSLTDLQAGKVCSCALFSRF